MFDTYLLINVDCVKIHNEELNDITLQWIYLTIVSCEMFS